jgi:hypothetical protein
MARIKIGILDEECIDRRIENEKKLKNIIKLRTEQLNGNKKTIN